MKRSKLILLLPLLALPGILAVVWATRPFQPSSNFILGTEQVEHGERNGEASEAYEALMWRRLSKLDENGRIREGALEQGYRQREQNMQAAPARGGLNRARWISRGPQNVGGRTRALVVMPNDSNIILAGAVGGGVWRSTNGGSTWTPTNDFLANLAVSSLAVDPNNPNVVYAGTGEGFFNSDALAGAGIFKSTDQGVTWTQLVNTSTFSTVDRISVATGNGNLVIAATAGGLRRSTNGGLTWTLVKAAQRAFFVAFDPIDSNNGIAQVLDFNFTIGQWFQDALYTRNGGQTWQTANIHTSDFSSRIELAYVASSPNTVYAMTRAPGGVFVYRSIDGGMTYAPMNAAGLPGDGQLWYNATLWISPANPNLVIVGIIHLFRSTDAGSTFTQISNGGLLTADPHPDAHCIVPDPGYNGISNNRVYFCNDGGVFRTDNISSAAIGSGWTSLNSTYQTTQFYGGTGNGLNRMVYGGTQDNGTLRIQAGSTVGSISFGGDGGWVAVDSTDASYCYGEFQGLNIHRSTNGGTSAGLIISGLLDAGTNSNFIAPFIIDPNDPNRLLAGGASVWRTNNAKAGTPTWTSIRPVGSSNISAIAVAPGNPNIIWIAQNDGKIYSTNDGLNATPTWTPIDDNAGANPLPNRYPTRILIDPNDSSTVYVTFGGFNDGNLRRTANSGANWSDVTGIGASGLPFVPIRGIARHPSKPTFLYVGTELGVFASEDAGATWSTANEGPANVSVDEINFMTGTTTLVAATHGRGIWTINLAGANVPLDIDGDVKSDFAVFRPLNGTWFVLKSQSGTSEQLQFGQNADVPVDVDFDGDFKADYAVWRPSTGEWFWRNSSDGSFGGAVWGANGDRPVPADYDGDGKTDLAVWRASDGLNYIVKSSGGFLGVQWGTVGDIPSHADLNGDGKTDFAVFRPSNGTWYTLLNGTSTSESLQFGQNGDIPVRMDVDGDQKGDIAVWRPSTGEWFYRRSSNGAFGGLQWGANGDRPVPGDYDGDGKTDFGVWRSTDGIHYIVRNSGGFIGVVWGGAGDVPVLGAPLP